jgi:hypothetical protein
MGAVGGFEGGELVVLSVTSTAAIASSRWRVVVAPTMGAVTTGLASSHARAICTAGRSRAGGFPRAVHVSTAVEHQLCGRHSVLKCASAGTCANEWIATSPVRAQTTGMSRVLPQKPYR